MSTDRPQAVASGRVTTVDQGPVASAQVVLFDLANLRQGPSQTVQTDANGHFALAYHPGRAYGLSVYGEGLATHIIPSFKPSDVGVITMHKATQPPSAKKLTGAGILGDVDGNGVVDRQDLIRIALYALDDAADLPDTDETITPQQMLTFFLQRWTVETTLEEARAHLGLETQRQWNDRAIARRLHRWHIVR